MRTVRLPRSASARRELDPETRTYVRTKSATVDNSQLPPLSEAISTFEKYRTIDHPLVHPIIRHSVSDSGNRRTITIVTPFVEGAPANLADLWGLLTARPPTPPPAYTPATSIIILYGIATALEHLHSQGLAHGGLNFGNVLLDRYFRPRLSDAGFWVIARERMDSAEPNAHFLARETAYDWTVTDKSDIFSFGIIAALLLTRKSPYSTVPAGTTEVCEWWEENEEFDLTTFTTSNELRSLLKKCLASDPAARPTITEVLADLNQNMGKLLPDAKLDVAYIRRCLANLSSTETPTQKLAKLAAAHDANAMFILAIQKRSPAQLKAAADAGSSLAAFHYAVALQFGRGVAKNQRQASEYYDRVINSEKSTQLANFARNNQAGLMEIGAIEGQKRFIQLYTRAAEAKVPEAIANIARCLQNGIGTPANPAQAARWAAQAQAAPAKRPKAEDPLIAAGAALASGRLAAAVAALEAADGPEAKFVLAAILGSEALLAEAAGGGAPAAQVNRALAIIGGAGKAEAVALLKAAAEAGNGYAKYNLGVAIERKIAQGTEAQAAELFREAAEAGVPEGMLAWADCLETGTGIAADVKQAAEWYARAAEESHGALTDADIAVKRLEDKP